MLKRIRLKLAKFLAPPDYFIIRDWRPAPVYIELESREFRRLS